MTTTPTGIDLDLRGSRHRTHDVGTWLGKAEAMKELRTLRERGLNVDPTIEAHHADDYLWRPWVLGRPDHYNGITYLMTTSGAWVPGRLFDASPCCCTGRCHERHGAPWRRLAGLPVEPATFTHVTRTVPDGANRHERYRTKSNGSCGRWVWTDESVALCTCGWRAYAATRDEARSRARMHRAEVGLVAA